MLKAISGKQPTAGFDSLRQAQDKPLSQLETRDCALSGVEGYNLGDINFSGNHLSQSPLLLNAGFIDVSLKGSLSLRG
jgi:hypothetical protein